MPGTLYFPFQYSLDYNVALINPPACIPIAERHEDKMGLLPNPLHYGTLVTSRNGCGKINMRVRNIEATYEL